MTREDEYDRCRVYRHAWDELQATDVDDTLFHEVAAVIVLRCVRCHAVRRDEVDALGDLVRRAYDYGGAPGYRRGPTDARVSFAELRLRRLKLLHGRRTDEEKRER